MDEESLNLKTQKEAALGQWIKFDYGDHASASEEAGGSSSFEFNFSVPPLGNMSMEVAREYNEGELKGIKPGRVLTSTGMSKLNSSSEAEKFENATGNKVFSLVFFTNGDKYLLKDGGSPQFPYTVEIMHKGKVIRSPLEYGMTDTPSTMNNHWKEKAEDQIGALYIEDNPDVFDDMVFRIVHDEKQKEFWSPLYWE